MTSNVPICIFWLRAECRTFCCELVNFEAPEKFVHASPKPKLENYESVQHRLQFSGIKKGAKISFHRHFNPIFKSNSLASGENTYVEYPFHIHSLFYPFTGCHSLSFPLNSTLCKEAFLPKGMLFKAVWINIQQ